MGIQLICHLPVGKLLAQMLLLPLLGQKAFFVGDSAMEEGNLLIGE